MCKETSSKSRGQEDKEAKEKRDVEKERGMCSTWLGNSVRMTFLQEWMRKQLKSKKKQMDEVYRFVLLVSETVARGFFVEVLA